MQKDIDPILKGIPDFEGRIDYKQIKSIWELSEPYQDQRDDEGHTGVVTQNGVVLLKHYPEANANVVLPACILHDIGWSQLTEVDRKNAVGGVLSENETLYFRYKHQIEGARLAINILNLVNYSPQPSVEIIEIIIGHDTRKGSLSLNDSVMRDADKLWRYSRLGMKADVERAKTEERGSYKYWIDRREKEIDKPGYFFTEAAIQVAKINLLERKKEFLVK